MKKIIVKENQKGLLFKNGKFVKLLEAGKYHLFGDSHAELLSAEGQLTSDTCTLETLLKAPEIARQVSVVEVGDQQMALHFVDGKFVHALRQGKYAFFAGQHKHDFQMVDVSTPVVDSSVPAYIFMFDPRFLLHKSGDLPSIREDDCTSIRNLSLFWNRVHTTSGKITSELMSVLWILV